MNSKSKETYESLVEKHGCRMIPLSEAAKYIGIHSLKHAVEKAVNLELPFPAFPAGKRRESWMVNAERLAEYLDSLDKEWAEKFDYKNG